jgi:hypothetical protein
MKEMVETTAAREIVDLLEVFLMSKDVKYKTSEHTLRYLECLYRSAHKHPESAFVQLGDPNMLERAKSIVRARIKIHQQQ